MTSIPFMLRHKALVPVMVLALMSAIYVSFSLYALFSQQRITDNLAERVYEIQRLSNLIIRIQDLTHPLLIAAASKRDAARDLDSAFQEINQLIETLQQNTAVTSMERELLLQTKQQLVDIQRISRSRILLTGVARDRQFAELEKLISGPLSDLCERLSHWHDSELQQADVISTQARSHLNALLIQTGILVLLAGALLAGAFRYYQQILVKPLLTLNHSTEILASGDLKHRIRLDSRDEIGQLAANINRMAGAFNALTERLAQAAETDALTGLLNRRAFNTIVEYELMASQTNHDSCTLALLDIDHFKKVNDTHGHTAGDAMLRHIAILCQQSIRRGDYCFRYGGEELAILMPSTTLDQAQIMLERARQSIETTPLETEGKQITATVSYGVASSPEDGNQRELLMQHADDALYRAKETGRNRGIAFRTMGKD